MTAQHMPVLPHREINWSKTAFLFGAAVTIAGWVAFGAQAAQRLSTLEARTQPLASGDLVRVQADVAWIRARMEEDRRQ